MATLTTILLDDGKEKLLSPDIIPSPKYFRIYDTQLNITPAISKEDMNNKPFWIQKPIDLYRIVDDNTVEFTCILENEESTSNSGSICLFFEDDVPFLFSQFTTIIPSGNRQIINIQFKLSNASKEVNFQFIKTDALEEGLLSLNTLVTLGNQITKNTTILNKIYLPDVLDTPCITSETFKIS